MKLKVIVYLVLFWLIIEFASMAVPRASAWAPYQYNTKIGILTPVPSLSMIHSAGRGELPFKLTTDENGFRKLENFSGADVKIRILFLGDSYTYGYGVNDSVTWPQYLLNLLKHDQISALGRNTAVPWMTIDQQAVVYDFFNRKEPYNLVILGFCSSNDYPEQYDIELLSKNFINHGIFPTFLKHSAFLRAFLKLTFVRSSQMQNVLQKKAETRPSHEVLASLYEQKFRNLVSKIRSNGQDLIVINIDPPPGVRKSESTPKDYLAAKANMKALTEELGIEFIETESLSDIDYLWPLDFHLSGAGNYHVAQLIFNSKTLRQLIK